MIAPTLISMYGEDVDESDLYYDPELAALGVWPWIAKAAKGVFRVGGKIGKRIAKRIRKKRKRKRAKKRKAAAKKRALTAAAASTGAVTVASKKRGDRPVRRVAVTENELRAANEVQGRRGKNNMPLIIAGGAVAALLLLKQKGGRS